MNEQDVQQIAQAMATAVTFVLTGKVVANPRATALAHQVIDQIAA